MLVDSHCHLQSEDFDVDRDEVIARAAAAGVGSVVCPATDAASARKAIDLARHGLPISVAVGIHPNAVGRVGPDEWEHVRALGAEPEVVAIGETGLDYYRGSQTAREQRALFAKHLALAAEHGLPVVVHNRHADDDVLAMLREWCSDPGGRTAVLHCFVGSVEFAERALVLGCYLGFGGPLTFKSAVDVRTTAAAVPLDRILVETDAPFLAPHPHRGARNEPAFVRHIAERLADVRGVGYDALAAVTCKNAVAVFGDRLLFARRDSDRSAA